MFRLCSSDNCRDLIRGGKGGKQACDSACSSGHCHRIRNTKSNFRTVQSNAVDMEDLLRKGKDLNLCAYHLSKHLASTAQVVVLPYQLLLQGSNRLIENNIVLWDEAHNASGTAREHESRQISSDSLEAAIAQVSFCVFHCR